MIGIDEVTAEAILIAEVLLSSSSEEEKPKPTKRRKRKIIKKRKFHGAYNLAQIVDDASFKEQFRMNRQSFIALMSIIGRNYQEKLTNSAISLEERLCITLK